MTSQVKPVPEGFHTVNAYLIVSNAAKALEFYAKAFGAITVSRMKGPDGKSTMHAEMRIGDSAVMLSEENPQWGARSPLTLGGCPVTLHLYVKDADKLFAQATEAGCTVLYPMEDTFWGDRYGKVKDPFGHEWGIATHKEDLSEREIEERAARFFAAMADSGKNQ